jgi:hypothetical protein
MVGAKTTKNSSGRGANKAPKAKDLKSILSKRVKEFTKELKSEGEKCGIILDVTVVVQKIQE